MMCVQHRPEPAEYGDNIILKMSANICAYKLVIENRNEEMSFFVNLYRDSATYIAASTLAFVTAGTMIF